MSFTIIDSQKWERKEHFNHFLSQVPCTYSATFKLDITRIRQSNQKFYPTMLYFITTIVNRHKEFRTALNHEGQVGFYDQMHPCYTIFHKDSETFSNLWTEYTPDYDAFSKAYQQDLHNYGDQKAMNAKPDIPENTFPISMVPWASFEGFNLNLQNGYNFLIPIFTMGKFYEENGRVWMPLAIQVHHAVCDGFHLCRFVNELQELLNA